MKLRGLFVGVITIDIQYLVDRFPLSNEKMFATKCALTVGGPATNASITFSYLGGNSHLLTTVGQHPFTSFMESELRHYNVELTDLSAGVSQLPTVSSIVTTSGSGDRAVIAAASSLPSNMSEMTVITNQHDYSVVLVDGFNMETCCTVAMQARQLGIPVVLDAGSWKKGMERLLPYVDIAICSEQFQTPNGSDQESVMAYLADQGVSYSAITRGERPILYRAPNDNGEIAIEDVEVVDTLGAGDILHGAFCYYYAKGHQFIPALLHASQVATLSCQTFGTRSWMEKGTSSTGESSSSSSSKSM
jgi:sugar/nucleoside kinase (ribokinase family)